MGVKILAHEGSRINDLVITLQLGVNSPSAVPPYTVSSLLHLFSYPRGCKIPKDRVVERL